MMKEVSKYSGFAAVAVSWVGFALCVFWQAPYWSEPVSQFGYYGTTRMLFGLTLTLIAALYYTFARHLDSYWNHASRTAILTGLFLLVTAWVPYEPYVRSFVFDIHNTAVVLTAIFYSLPMLFIGYKKVHKTIARISQLLFFVTVALTSISMVARFTDTGIIYAQILAIIPVHAWLIITNTLLLRQPKEISAGYTGKL